jgi:PAS domain S-box-containing protein
MVQQPSDLRPGQTEDAASLRALVDTIVDGVVIIDVQGLIRVFNPACERLFGYAQGEVVGQNVAMLMPEPYRREHDDYLEAYRRTGQRKIIGLGREVVGRRKDGSTFPMELSVGETRLGSGNAYVGVIRDVTERKQAERRLRDGEARLRAVIDTVVDGVVMIDANGLIRMFNPASEWLFGYRAREVLGKNVSMLMPNPYRSEHDAYLHHYRRTGERRIIGIGREVLGLRKNGETFPMELSVGEMIQSGEQMFVGVIRDISDRKRADERQKLLAAELDHRAKNMIALVQAIIRQTRAATVEEFASTLDGRVAAVATAHILLAESGWSGAEMRRLLEEQFRPFVGASEAVKLSGPPLSLAPTAAHALAIILHELTTNSVKHGALASADGRLAVDWSLQREFVAITWAETGPSLSDGEPQRAGFGTRMLDQLVKHQLGGEIERRWSATGLTCRITLPKASVQREEQGASSGPDGDSQRKS